MGGGGREGGTLRYRLCEACGPMRCVRKRLPAPCNTRRAAARVPAVVEIDARARRSLRIPCARRAPTALRAAEYAYFARPGQTTCQTPSLL